MALKEGRHAVLDELLRPVGVHQLGHCQREPAVDIPAQRLFHPFAVALAQLAEPLSEHVRPPGLEHRVSLAEVGRIGLDLQTEFGEQQDRRLEHRQHVGFDRQSTERRTPGDTPAPDLGVQRDRCVERSDASRQWDAGVGTGHRGQQQRDIGHRPGHRAVDRVGHPWRRARPRRHQARGRSQTNHAVPRPRVSERAAEVATVGERNHPARQRRSRAAA